MLLRASQQVRGTVHVGSPFIHSIPGKPVLCEKALGLNSDETSEMVALARRKGLFLMEAIWSRSFPSYKRLRQMIQDKAIGEPMSVMMSMGMKLPPGINLFRADAGGGTVLDVAVYPIQLIVAAFGNDLPQKIVATTVGLNEDGVDLGVSATLLYSGGRAATFSTDLRCDTTHRAWISGSDKILEVGERLYAPDRLTTSTLAGGVEAEEKFPHLDPGKHRFNYPGSQGLIHEADEVKRCLNLGLKESPLMTLDESVLISRIQEEINAQIGVVCHKRKNKNGPN